MFCGPYFIASTMQEETTPIFKRLWYNWTQQQPGIEPTNPLGQCWVPPIVAFYDQQGLLRTFSLPGGSIRSPHHRSPRGKEGGGGYTESLFFLMPGLQRGPFMSPHTISRGYWEPILFSYWTPTERPLICRLLRIIKGKLRNYSLGHSIWSPHPGELL